jgi:hypothetical protein
MRVAIVVVGVLGCSAYEPMAPRLEKSQMRDVFVAAAASPEAMAKVVRGQSSTAAYG